MQWQGYDYKAQWSAKFGVVHRPLLQVKLSNGTKAFWPLSLIDSGSDGVLINSEIAEPLGINLSPCKEVQVGGVGSAKGKECDVTFEIPELNIKCDISVIFIENLPFNVLLGQRDFFSRVNVRFEKNRNKFYLKLPE